MHRLALVLLPLIVLAADKSSTGEKTKDLCSPPPGLAAPTLPAHIMIGQGRVHFPITTANPKAQEFFDQGVAQMHSFWAMEAERSFLQAAALDPEAPMPQWGIAMVAAGDYRPRFQLAWLAAMNGQASRKGKGSRKVQPAYPGGGGPTRAVAAAKKALELSPAPGKATPIEKLYIAAVAARRDPNITDRDAAYIGGLRAIVAAYPHEVEARSYLALHLMGGFTTPGRQPREGSMEAVKLLRELVVEAPDHPGVHHYIIHGFEGSTFARDAWPSCRRYPELVTNIPHALHMPGHIWAQTGKWDEAAHAFESAAENELGYIRADQLYGRGHHGHNVHFLITTYAFQGQYDDAVKAARGLLAFKENPREQADVNNYYTAYRQGWFGLMRTLVSFEKWDEILDGQTLPVYDRPHEQAWRHWAMGLAHAGKGDAARAKSELRSMNAALKQLSASSPQDVPGSLRVARKELEGQIAWAAHRRAKSLAVLQQAAHMERSLRYTEPPTYPRPVSEVVGRKAMEEGKPQMAEAAFRDVLDQFPESSRALTGLADAQRRQGKSEGSGF
jgi:tetratricopeptide (TPR) repeat protein